MATGINRCVSFYSGVYRIKGPVLKLIKEILESGLETSEAELRQEIKERQDLLKQMVGSLYPSIILDEIVKIREMLDETDTGNPYRSHHAHG